MIGLIFQGSYQINYGMALIEAIFAAILLYFLINFINVSLPEEDRIPKVLNKRSSSVSSLIVFGIILGIRFIFETFGYFIFLIRYLNNDYVLFAVMISLFYPINKTFLKKFDNYRLLGEKCLIPENIRKRLKKVILFTWIIALIFLSFDLLGVQLIWERYPYPPKYDIFYLGLLWTFLTVFFNISIAYLINMIRSDEKKLPKGVLNNAMILSGIIAFGIYSVQLIVFEIYLNRVFGINLIVQDIRVLIAIVSTIYVIVFFNLLKAKFLPEVTIRSHKKVQAAIKEERKVAFQNSTFRETKSITYLQELDDQFALQESALYSLESVSLKLYLLLSKKFKKPNSFEEKPQLHKNSKNTSKILIVGLLWTIVLIMVLLRLFLFSVPLDLIFEILFIGAQSAFFMVLIDISLIILVNKIIPVEKRIPKEIIRTSIRFGGIFLFWIWYVLLFLVFLYLFILISDVIISDLIFITISSIIYSLIGIFSTRWRARKKNWGNSFKKASLIYLIWLVLDIPLKIFITDTIQSVLISNGIFISLKIFNLFYDLFLSIIYLLIGLPIVLKVYKTKFKESLKFISIQQIIIFFAIIILGYTLGFVDNLISKFHFVIDDIRVPLVVISGLYLLSFLVSLKVGFLYEVPKESEKKHPKELRLIREELPQENFIEEKEAILNVQNLTTYFYTEEGIVKAVEGVSFKVYKGEVLGLVGETGSGKSVTALSILRLVRPPGRIELGKVIFRDEDLLQKSEAEILKYRGKDITMIFQDPLNSLNPVFKIGSQISEVFLLHMENELLLEAIKYSDKNIYSIAREWSEKLLRDLNIPFPEVVFDRYPHELSGGMRQRVQIAMALACSPKLLIADEPTTALDVTIQNQILKLMKDLRKKFDTSILFITHDLGIISKISDRVAVMYSGFIVEYGRIKKLFTTPYHPYTKGLISSVPVVGKKRRRLEIISGMVPNPIYPPSGCRFHPRCQYCFEPCNSKVPKSIEVEPTYFVACHLYDPEYENLAEIAIKKVEEKALLSEHLSIDLS